MDKLKLIQGQIGNFTFHVLILFYIIDVKSLF